MREVKVKAAAPAALRRKLRRPAKSIARSSLGMTANHGNAGEAGGGEKPTKTGVMALTVNVGFNLPIRRVLAGVLHWQLRRLQPRASGLSGRGQRLASRRTRREDSS